VSVPVPPYAELAAATNFSFLRGASHPQDMVLTALLLGQTGIGIADRNTVAGTVRAYAALRQLRDEGLPMPQTLREGSSPGEVVQIVPPESRLPLPSDEMSVRAKRFRLAVGTRFVFADGTPDIVAYPTDREAWGRLCRILTVGNLRGRKGECLLRLDDVLAEATGLLFVMIPERKRRDLGDALVRLAEAAPGSAWLGVALHRHGDDRRHLIRRKAMAEAAGVPLLAVNDALYADPDARDLQDVVTCIREGVTIETAGRRLEANAERHLKAPREMAALFREVPEALAETQDFLARITFEMDELKYDYPEEPVPPGKTPQGWLEEQTWRRAELRYPNGVPAKVDSQLRTELALIRELKYARYFLTIFDIVRVAEDKGILCQGRGSAANSAVCYVLGITAVDPMENDLLFARFISTERREPPDIDVDFEHERREEIIQHIYGRYGRERAGIAATVIRYRPRSAMREVGKVLGLTEDVTARLASTQWGSFGSDIPEAHIRQTGLDPKNPEIARALGLARRLLGFPRHLSQHVGGFVLTRGRLDETVPIGNAAMKDRTFIEWDKDDIDALGLMKIDVLALGMLTCIRKSFDLMRLHHLGSYELATVPNEGEQKKAVYAMLQKGDSLGVFQVESRAQMNMLPRLKPEKLYDLVIQVAIVRPGPIQGNMVHPYLRRRADIEKVTYPSPSKEHGDSDELKEILHKTLGVPLFQEQAMRLAMVAAKFTDVQANGLRRAMATFRHVGTIGNFERLMVDKMVERGYERDFAQRCFEQIKGFGSYGFPESHAASFAKLVYISSWIKCHQPAVFACALLNSQPMGFYAPAQIVRDAEEHGVPILPVDVSFSHWDNILERTGGGVLALRIGFRQVAGLNKEEMQEIAAMRGNGFESIEEMASRTGMSVSGLRVLAGADAFRSLGHDRRAALWIVRRLPSGKPLPLFAAAEARELGPEPEVALPQMPLGAHVAADYRATRLSLKGHPMGILRPVFAVENVLSAAGVRDRPDGAFGHTAGIVLVRQRPGNGNAIFVTLEDETGITNVIVWARLFERFRREVMAARLMQVSGPIQHSKEGIVHIVAQRIVDRSPELSRLSEEGSPPIAWPSINVDAGQDMRGLHGHPRNVRLLPRSRDFH
jgi:error-prone DNA polymerase